MKRILLVLLMFICITVSYADIVYVTDVRAEADLVIYVTESQIVADMKITISDRLQATQYSNHWYFTTIRAEADKLIFYSSNQVGATKVYFTEYNGTDNKKNQVYIFQISKYQYIQGIANEKVNFRI